MRKRRVIIYHSEDMILRVMGNFFASRGYEIVTFDTPVVCPVDRYKGTVSCTNLYSCADIIISDFAMPVMNGLDLFRSQLGRSCKVPIKNRAFISGEEDRLNLAAMQEEGYTIFSKPFNFNLISKWLVERERDTDLSRPLGATRRERRQESNQEISYMVLPSTQKLNATATNVSPSGMCMKVQSSIMVKQEMFIISRSSGEYRSASVRWMKKVSDKQYLAGVSFVK